MNTELYYREYLRGKREAREEHRIRLRDMLRVQPDPSLPLKTQAEQIAGRNRVMLDLRRSIANIGKEELRERFGQKAIRQADVYDIGQWMAEVTVVGSNGREMCFSDPLMDFPSENTIAQIALIV
jgi:hypothetical protein